MQHIVKSQDYTSLSGSRIRAELVAHTDLGVHALLLTVIETGKVLSEPLVSIAEAETFFANLGLRP